MRKLLSLMALFVVALLALPAVSALNEDNFGWMIEVNDNHVLSSNDVQDVVDDNGVFVGEDTFRDGVSVPSVSVEEGERMNIKVTLTTGDRVEDIEVEAELKGYEYSDYEDLSDSTHLFDMAANTQKTVRLSFDLPKNLDKEIYWLHLNIYNQASSPVRQIVKLNVEPARHGLDIADVSLSPGNTVKAGRSLLTTVLLQNFGDKDEKDVKVTVAIPALGVTQSEFVDVIRTDNHNIDYEDVPEMWLQIPATAAEGDYEVVVSARYDDLRETVAKRFNVHVVPDERFQARAADTLVLAVGPELQNVATGKTATYAVALTNAGVNSKAYLLEVVAGDWATASLSENMVVLSPGSNQVVYVDLTAAGDAAAGEHVASLVVKSGSEVLETIPLRANVVPGAASADGFSLRNGLEIALIVLVVLLVIIGLIIGFSRLRKDEEEDEQTYY